MLVDAGVHSAVVRGRPSALGGEVVLVLGGGDEAISMSHGVLAAVDRTSTPISLAEVLRQLLGILLEVGSGPPSKGCRAGSRPICTVDSSEGRSGRHGGSQTLRAQRGWVVNGRHAAAGASAGGIHRRTGSAILLRRFAPNRRPKPDSIDPPASGPTVAVGSAATRGLESVDGGGQG